MFKSIESFTKSCRPGVHVPGATAQLLITSGPSARHLDSPELSYNAVYWVGAEKEKGPLAPLTGSKPSFSERSGGLLGIADSVTTEGIPEGHTSEATRSRAQEATLLHHPPRFQSPTIFQRKLGCVLEPNPHSHLQDVPHPVTISAHSKPGQCPLDSLGGRCHCAQSPSSLKLSFSESPEPHIPTQPTTKPCQSSPGPDFKMTQIG